MKDSLFCSKQFRQKRISLARTTLLLINYWRKLGLNMTQGKWFYKDLGKWNVAYSGDDKQKVFMEFYKKSRKYLNFIW